MTGTGNDIISLNAINVDRAKQPWFYSHILSSSERTLYDDSELSVIPFENFIWLLWSIKESAFKYLQRNKPDLIFSPTKFIVQQLQMPSEYIVTSLQVNETEDTGFDSKRKDVLKGTINVGSYTLFSRSIIYKELIVSVVNGSDNFENTCWGIKIITKSDSRYQSKAVREFLINRLHNDFERNDLVIGKSLNGFPIVLDRDKEIGNSISLSHHDHLVAYSFQLGDFQNN